MLEIHTHTLLLKRHVDEFTYEISFFQKSRFAPKDLSHIARLCEASHNFLCAMHCGPVVYVDSTQLFFLAYIRFAWRT